MGFFNTLNNKITRKLDEALALEEIKSADLDNQIAKYKRESAIRREAKQQKHNRDMLTRIRAMPSSVEVARSKKVVDEFLKGFDSAQPNK